MTAAVPNWQIVGPRSADADLVRAAAAGDRQAFAVMYDRYANRLHDFCAGMLADRDAAADCVQDTFCTAATCLGDLREPDRLRGWLYGIARHQALRRIRDRRKEQLSDELPDIASQDAGPDTMAGRSELATLIAEAAGGLSDRDRAVLELAYRHGLDGPELAAALGVSQTNANTMVYRLRDTIEKCLGALLVARRARTTPDRCPQLVAILKGWDGQFTILMRKRIARHIESCPVCEQERRRMVNPVALLGAAPIFIPAPAWLRDRTLREVQLTCSGTGLMAAAPTQPVRPEIRWRRDEDDVRRTYRKPEGVATDDDRARHKFVLLIGLFAGVPLAILVLTISWMYLPNVAIDPSSGTEPAAPQSVPVPAAPPPAAPPNAPPPRAPASAPDRPDSVPPVGVAPRVPSADTAPQPVPGQPPNVMAPAPVPAPAPAAPPPLPNVVVPQVPLLPNVLAPAPLPAAPPVLPNQVTPPAPDVVPPPAPQPTALTPVPTPAPTQPQPQPGLGDTGLIPPPR